MLTERENFIQCITGGKPERYVKQFEYMQMYRAPTLSDSSRYQEDGIIVNEWGVAMRETPDGSGLFPLHDMDHRVVKDIETWREQVRYPASIPQERWDILSELMEGIDRNEVLATVAVFPGVFENTHHMCEITETLAAFYEYPDELHEVMNAVTERELEIAEGVCKYAKPDAIFHHDDWGTKTSTFISPQLFEEFLLEPYKQIYGYYKNHGVDYIIHHSDSFGETLVPYMIELGIDVWQGVLRETNDIPTLLEKYGEKIAFMGAIESAHIDVPEWTSEMVEREVNEALDCVGSKTSFIPCLTAGLNDSSYQGVYDEVNRVLDERSKVDFVADDLRC